MFCHIRQHYNQDLTINIMHGQDPNSPLNLILLMHLCRADLLGRWILATSYFNPLTSYCRFSGGMLNVCYNAVDRHVEAGNGNQTAIIYDSPVTGVVDHISYSDLLHQV